MPAEMWRRVSDREVVRPLRTPLIAINRDKVSDTSAQRDQTSDTPASANPLLEAVIAAISSGARSWSAVGREAGCSRQWAKILGTRAGLDLTGAGPNRDAKLSLRVRGAALAELDAFAAAESARTGRPISRSDAARQLLGEALAARRGGVR